jgi:hypothetical protein
MSNLLTCRTDPMLAFTFVRTEENIMGVKGEGGEAV